MTVVSINDVSFTYYGSEKPALDGINLCIEKAEFLAVMGKNGSGKTAFCKLFNGLIPHITRGKFCGKVIVDGIDTGYSSVPQLALKTGIVLDDPDAQLFTSTVKEEAAFGAENLLLPAEEIIERVEQSLEAVGLAGFKDRQVSSLSGGEKQRLSIACALAMRPKILVLDEPLCRLDPAGKNDVMAVLKELNSRYKMTIIMATHDSEKIRDYADRVCVLKDSRIAACDKTEVIFKNKKLLEESGIQQPQDADIYTFFSEKKEKSDYSHNAVIEIKNFSFSYSKEQPLIKNLNITIKENDFIGIIGKNGCGKTTLLKCITGLLRSDCGEIFIYGKKAGELKVWEISKEIGYVMQNPDNQLFTDSVFNEVSYALKNAGLSKTEIKEKADNALNIAGLNDKEAFPHALSRQERAKVVLACVLAMGCKIIILDEIDAGQDYTGCMQIMKILKELHAAGYTIIFVTHNMSLICNYADRLIVMEKDCTISEWERK